MTAPTLGLAKLSAALSKVQAELPKLERDRTVEVTQKSGATYSYSYVTLANLSDAILPLLGKHGLSFVAMPGAGADGKMCVRYHLLHDSGEALSGEFPISGEGGIQMIGGRITYARRYCLAAIVGVAADEDDETRLSEDGTRGTAQRAPQNRQQPPAADGQQPTVQRAKPKTTAPAGARPLLPGENSTALTAPQRAKMLAIFSKIGISDRGERLQLSSQIVNRRLGSANDLTKAEGMTLIDTLENAAVQSDPKLWLKETVGGLPIDEPAQDDTTQPGGA